MVGSSQDQPMVLSKVHYIADRHCGYCNGNKKDYYALKSMSETSTGKPSESIIIGTSIEQMTCKQYDELINQGFRRSGTFLYKPDLLRGCCRYYTIRTSMDFLKVSKQQRKVVNRFIREISNNDITTPKHGNQERYDLGTLIKAEIASSRFRTRFEPSKFSKEKYELYKKYQMKVHNDEESKVSPSSFARFLCDTPFLDSEKEGKTREWEMLNNWTKNYGNSESNQPLSQRRVGPTHECYYLDDKLIAISVLDFLPSGISSIYFIWDPDYAHLSLGTLSGLREILMCRELGYDYYYLGFYIDDCEKMKYKSKFGGEVLDLCNEVYVPFQKCAEFMKDGRLFILGEDDADTQGVELELENSGHPESFDDSIFKDKDVKNIAEYIYGDRQIFKVAEVTKKVLEQIFGIKGQRGPYAIPDVMPGIIPLWQIVEWLENGVLDEEFPVGIFRLLTSDMVECTFGELRPLEKGIIIDFIRIFGLSKVQQSIILV